MRKEMNNCMEYYELLSAAIIVSDNFKAVQQKKVNTILKNYDLSIFKRKIEQKIAFFDNLLKTKNT